MKTTDLSQKSIALPTNKYGYLLTIAIIAIRAFQPNAQPMCDWSIFSWCMMCIPIFVVWLVYIVFIALWIWANAVSKY